jgi:hypothetical protein
MSLKDLDDRKHPNTDEVVREGAALDGAQSEGAFAGMPRVLRYALDPNRVGVGERVAADVTVLAPHLSGTVAAWASTSSRAGWQATAAALDEAAVRLDEPSLRALADVVRMLSMTADEARAHATDTLRVVAALTAASREAPDFTADHAARLAEVDLYVIGWSHLASGARSNSPLSLRMAHAAAHEHGRESTLNLVAHTDEAARERHRTAEAAKARVVEAEPDEVRHVAQVPTDHLVVCPALGTGLTRLKDALKGHEHAVGVALPMAATPDVSAVRRALVFEYPYAVSEVDRLLSPLVGRGTVHLPPTIVVGPPGSGKSRLLRRLAEELGTHCWRTDGSRADGNTFGGTDRRWYSVEPCHPFLAVSRGRVANPLVLVDEVDKAATRTDHGRLWDALLPFLERETASAYPDPALQVDLDLSAVSFVMTANSIDGLPAPLVDRCRGIAFPEPTAADLVSLLPALLRDHARDADLDARWVEPLTIEERGIVARRWRGGSVRRLRGVVDAVLRGRERMRPVH